MQAVVADKSSGPLRVADVLLAVFGALLAIAWIGPALASPASWSYVLRNFGVVSLYVVVYRIRMPTLTAAAWLRIALLAVVAPFNYFQAGALIEALQPTSVPRIEAFLLSSDLALVGEGFHDWLRDIRNPIATEILQLCYASFYVLPVLLLVILSARGKMRWVPEISLGVVFALLVTYLCYLVVPARSPGFLDPSVAPSEGVWMAGQIWVFLRELGNGAHDAFPSGHTAISLLVLYYAAKCDRVAVLVLGPIACALIVSTVYLQYHYILDVFAGAMVAGLAVWFGRRMAAQAPVEIPQLAPSGSRASRSPRLTARPPVACAPRASSEDRRVRAEDPGPWSRRDEESVRKPPRETCDA